MSILADSRKTAPEFAGIFPPSPPLATVSVLPARFVSKVEIDDNGCWIWQASRTRHGYGRIGRGGRGMGSTTAYAFAYQRVFGEVPTGLVLDHLCRVPACANPWHLEPVTQAENCRRGRQANAAGLCRAGKHEWVPENIYTEGNGVQRCHLCRNEWERSQSVGIAFVLRTHCPRGHAYDEANTYVKESNGHRTCRACHRENERRRYRIRKGLDPDDPVRSHKSQR